MQTANEVLGTGDLMKTNNGDDRDVVSGDEDAAREEISEKLNAEVPEFYYLPEGDGITRVTEIFDEVGYAKISYSYQNGYIHLTISNSSTDMSQGNVKERKEDSRRDRNVEWKDEFCNKRDGGWKRTVYSQLGI